MNRFTAAGLRCLREEIVRKGGPEFAYGRLPVPEGTVLGDEFPSGAYVVTADEDRGDDGECACRIVLDPVRAAEMLEYKEDGE